MEYRSVVHHEGKVITINFPTPHAVVKFNKIIFGLIQGLLEEAEVYLSLNDYDFVSVTIYADIAGAATGNHYAIVYHRNTEVFLSLPAHIIMRMINDLSRNQVLMETGYSLDSLAVEINHR
jgi:hypothetical protein